MMHAWKRIRYSERKRETVWKLSDNNLKSIWWHDLSQEANLSHGKSRTLNILSWNVENSLCPHKWYNGEITSCLSLYFDEFQPSHIDRAFVRVWFISFWSTHIQYFLGFSTEQIYLIALESFKDISERGGGFQCLKDVVVRHSWKKTSLDSEDDLVQLQLHFLGWKCSSGQLLCNPMAFE